ncbi:MAG: AmmeMemoRadiSam system protein B [Thermodesulfobacteriota bacterium]|nr:AmmeMemoRadiSam system protein B [Thermodesulfobacteriota bacterium]
MEVKRKDYIVFRFLGMCIFISSLIINLLSLTAIGAESTRGPAVAGYFYPKNQSVLMEMVDQLIKNVKQEPVHGKILGLISPHAGYVYSGQVAAYSYRQIKNKSYDTVIILGPSHHVYFRGVSVGNWDLYETPLGNVRVNREISNKLLNSGEIFQFIEKAHIKEHSIETQIPFLQRTLKNFDIVPIVTGALSIENCEEISDILVKIAKEKNILFIASSDMSHYPNYDNANKVDSHFLSLIENYDPLIVFNAANDFLKKEIPNLVTTMCGLNSVVTVMMTVKKCGGKGAKILHYANSGDVSIQGYKRTDRVVGYGAVAFYKK